MDIEARHVVSGSRAANNFGHCKGCGRQVIWIKTKAGKNMPVDTTLHCYRKDPNGKEKIVTEHGDVVTGNIVYASHEEADGMGYISHFATCPQAGNFKKGRR